MHTTTLTPDTPTVVSWKDRLADRPTEYLLGVLDGDPDAVDASHRYACELILQDRHKVIGHVYVDSGQVLITDPCRALEFDEAACEFDAHEGEVISPTYCGDGAYPVIAEMDEEGRVVRLIVELIPDAIAD
jgi:hypothetical protein